MTIKHIVLDIGRVLVRWEPERAYLELIPDQDRRARFLAEICNDAWNREQDRGRSWADAEATLIARYPEEERLIRAYRANWPQMLPGTVDGTPAIMRALLEAGWDVTLLTNFSQETFPIATEMFPFLGEARGVTVSGELRVVKPDPAIYAHHTRAFGLNPAATLFFDDSPANVEGALAAGWHARPFTDARVMRADLASFGIDVP